MASWGHRGFSHFEGSVQLQAAELCLSGRHNSGVSLRGPPSVWVVGHVSENDNLCTSPRFRLRASGHGRPDLPFLSHDLLRAQLRI